MAGITVRRRQDVILLPNVVISLTAVYGMELGQTRWICFVLDFFVGFSRNGFPARITSLGLVVILSVSLTASVLLQYRLMLSTGPSLCGWACS
jgi:hypothetical protein